jgi:hypothetical protein
MPTEGMAEALLHYSGAQPPEPNNNHLLLRFPATPTTKPTLNLESGHFTRKRHEIGDGDHFSESASSTAWLESPKPTRE